MVRGIESFVNLSPAVWPGKDLPVQPGDLSGFVPMGNGLGGPAVMMPWDDLGSMMRRQSFYSWHAHTGHPMGGAPVTEAEGGVVHFGHRCDLADVAAMLRLLGVHARGTRCAAFAKETENAQEDRWLTAMRIVSPFAMRFMFGAVEDDSEVPEQPLAPAGLVCRFIEHFREEYAQGRYDVRGALDGDGDWARESLAFGFMVENAYHGVWRVWTRAWLVTK
ncbi:MAG: hypothetical protein K2W96_05790 [Gemmataceae bacterium]|nr:hypothetical protein [Gemmataceae bacterium]